MKLSFRHTRWILPSVCVALLLLGAVASPCTAQVIEVTGTFVYGSAPRSHNRSKASYRALSGPCEVGRTEFDWVDPSRPDPVSPGGHREIAVWLWYPASPKMGAEAAEWMPGKWGELLLRADISSKRKSNGQELRFRNWRKVSRNIPSVRFGRMAYPDAPIYAKVIKKFSVQFYLNLRFRHASVFLFSTLIEDLASSKATSWREPFLPITRILTYSPTAASRTPFKSTHTQCIPPILNRAT